MSMESRIDEIIAKTENLLKIKEAELASIEAEEAQALAQQDRSAEIIAQLSGAILTETDGESDDEIALEREIERLERELQIIRDDSL